VAYYPITPVPAPRMTQADRWKNRDCVLRYRAFRDEVRLRKVVLRAGDSVTFHLPMPDSWCAKKKATMNGGPHLQKPDVDNLFKALADSIHEDDAHIHSISIKKIWNYSGGISVNRGAAS